MDDETTRALNALYSRGHEEGAQKGRHPNMTEP